MLSSPEIEAALNLVREGRHEDALDAFAELAAKRPEMAVAALGHRAWHLRALGRYAEAVSDWDRVLAVVPGDLETQCLRAEALVRTGNPIGGVQAALGVLREDPLYARAVEIVREAHASLGLAPVPGPAKPGSAAFAEALAPANRAIQALERAAAGFSGSVHPEAGRFLYGLVRVLRPGTVVETGSWIGYSALCIGQALEDNGGGHLHSFDVFGERDGWESPITGPCSDSLAMARAHVEYGGLSHRVTFHQGDSSTRIRDRFAGKPGSVDLAFIDGDHRVEGVLRDWEAVDEVLAPGGLVLLHDTEPRRCGWYGPRYLMEGVASRHAERWRTIHLATAEGAGMGILQKIVEEPTETWRPPLDELVRDRLVRSTVRRRLSQET